MTAAFSAFDQQALRRDSGRRLSVAIGASVIIHALAIAALRDLAPTAIHAYSQRGAGSLTVLQAVLAEPVSEPQPAQPDAIEPPIEPVLVLPPDAHPLTVPEYRPPPGAAALEANPDRFGPGTPEANTAVGIIDDPSRIGPDYVARLAERFPQRAQNPPRLLGSLVVPYPPAALESRSERRVVVLLTLRADGSIAESHLVDEDPVFGSTALEALKKAHFSPAETDGKPIPYWAIVEFVFSLGHPVAPPAAERGTTRRGLAYPYPRQPSVGR